MPLNISERINARKEQERDRVSDAFVSLSGIIGRDDLNTLLSEARVNQSLGALQAVLRSLGIRKEVRYQDEKDLTELLNNTVQPLGIMYRGVRLEEKWYTEVFGSYLATLDDGRLVALIPGRHGYSFIDNVMTEPVRVTPENASRISRNAICFCRPFPQRKMELKDLTTFFFSSLSGKDCVRMGIFTLLASLVTLLVPMINSYIFNDFISVRDQKAIIAVFLTLLFTYLIIYAIGRIKTMFYGNMKIKADTAMNSAVMMRLLSLPASFFKENSSGTVSKWIFILKDISSRFFEFLFSTLLGLVTCLVLIIQMFSVSKGIALVVLGFFVLQLIFSAFAIRDFARNKKKQFIAQTEEDADLHSAIAGIQKIRISGSENRVFANWAEKYGKLAKTLYKPPLTVVFYQPINLILSLSMMLTVYYAAYRGGVSGTGYMVFASAFTMFSSASASLMTAALEFAAIPSALDVVRPFFEESPEIIGQKKSVTKLSGDISLRHIKFGYSPDMPPVIDDLSLEIAAGSYVAIVGKSGCGKSTLIRLMLGMEKLKSGLIMYGNHNLENVDIRSVRRRIGIVMQDAQLFPGTIRYNISISAPLSSEEDIWRAARLAGIEDMIRNLPMGLDTVISGNDGGLSGGQKQRIAIARAIISDPDIIMFDEATSALDNVSQKAVVEALDELKCTRVVVSHRLSTIKTCDRIIMLENGGIAEDGTYEELIARNGKFAELVRRQQLGNNE